MENESGVIDAVTLRRKSVERYVRRLFDNVGLEQTQPLIQNLCEQLLQTPRDLSALIQEEIKPPEDIMERLEQEEALLSRPRALYFPLQTELKGGSKKNKKNKSQQLTYLIFNQAPNFTVPEELASFRQQNWENTQNLDAISVAELAAIKALPIQAKPELMVWQGPALKVSDDFHQGVKKLFGVGVDNSLKSLKPNTLNENASEGSALKNTIHTQRHSISKAFTDYLNREGVQGFRQGIWMPLTKKAISNFFHYEETGALIPAAKPIGVKSHSAKNNSTKSSGDDNKHPDYCQLDKDDRVFARFEIDNIYLDRFSVGVNSVVVALRFLQLDIVAPDNFLKGEVPLCLEDIRELNYILADKERGKRESAQLCYPYLADISASSAPYLERVCDGLKKEGVATNTQHLEQCLGKSYAFGLERDESFTLTELLECLLPGNEALHSSFARPLIYTMMLSGKDHRLTKHSRNNDYLKRLLCQMAHLHNQGYVGVNHSSYTHWGDSDIEHYAAREGGVVLINPNISSQPDRDFHEGFMTDKGRQVYLNILLLAYMQYSFLHGVDQTLELSEGDLSSDQRFHSLKELQQYLIEFRVNDIFTDVSILDIHNQSYKAWEKHFSLKALIEQLEKDMSDTRTLLEINIQEREITAQKAQQKREKEHDRNVKNIATVGTGIIFLSGVFGTNFKEMTDPAVELWSLDWHWAVLGVVIGVVTWFLHYVNKPKDPAEQGLRRSRTALKAIAALVSITLILFGGLGGLFYQPEPSDIEPVNQTVESCPATIIVNEQALLQGQDGN
ncbi:hypothetical protein [Oceanospirillum beijerinckii]|uniref:hypothetical protein n=1 Tax=Oceanospirillum beijerinckii TaxID=64976 RepID=UPI00040DB90F|nr:hypothetical protein [Oceanospirillum beijerinckii]